MTSPRQQRKKNLNALDQMLEEEAPVSKIEVYREIALETGVSKKTIQEYIELLGYKIEDGQVKRVEN